MEEICALCHCKEKDCLAFVPDANIWLCNGKGSISTSHLLRFLLKTGLHHIKLHDSNPLSQLELKCAVCGNENVLELGFLNVGDKLYIACKQKCRYEIDKERKSEFIPLVSNRQFDQQFIHIPKNDQMRQFTQFEVQELVNQYHKSVGIETEFHDPNDLRHIRRKYDSFEQYRDIMIPCIKSEMAYASFKAKTTVFQDVQTKWTDPQRCTMVISSQLANMLSFGSSVRVSDKIKNMQDETNLDIGTVAHIDKRQRVLNLKFTSGSKFFNIDKLCVAQNFLSTPFDRQIDAVSKMNAKADPFILKVFYGQFEENFDKGNKFKAIALQEPPQDSFDKLNEPQIEAVQKSLSQRFTYIQGPPGTGKTTVIATIVNSLVKANIKPVLVLGHSNITADFACQMLDKAGLNVGRTYSLQIEDIYTPNDNDRDDFEDNYRIPGFDPTKYSTFRVAMQEFQGFHNKAPNLALKRDRDEVYQFERDTIREKDAVCMTTCMAGSKRADLPFKALIVDEAGQCTDPDLLIGVCHQCERVILVGDNMQLQPIIFSPKCQTARYDFNLISRVIASQIDSPMLLTQYRMHPLIANFSSKQFYHEKLQNGVGEEQRVWDKAFIPWPVPNKPLFYWNIKDSSEEFSPDGNSYLNPSEGLAIAAILDYVCEKGETKPESIGIITPYNGQQEYLIDNLSTICHIADKDFINKIEISSVDSFQGREKDFIIFSCVRSNSDHIIGFCSNKRRLNVSITRAKYGLILLGNAETFSKSKLWCDFINYFIEQGVFVEGSLGNFTASTFDPKPENDEESDPD